MGQLTVSAVKAAIRLGRHADSATLYLNVKRSGAKSWGQRAVVDGRRHDLGLDPYPAVSLAKARRRAGDATPDDMDLPGFRLHPPKGKHAGYWAVTVSANWRMIFRFEEGHAVDVGYLEYH